MYGIHIYVINSISGIFSLDLTHREHSWYL